jgi:hypothetical protein
MLYEVQKLLCVSIIKRIIYRKTLNDCEEEILASFSSRGNLKILSWHCWHLPNVDLAHSCELVLLCEDVIGSSLWSFYTQLSYGSLLWL